MSRQTLFAAAAAVAALSSPLAVSGAEISGLLEPARVASLSPNLDAPVAGIAAREGDVVVFGQPLIQLDASVQQARVAAAAATPAAARIARAEANADSARSMKDRVDRAAQRGAAPKWEVEESGFRLKEARADLSLAQDLAVADDRRLALEEAILAQYTLRAPFDGVVTEVTVELGETANRGEPAITVADLNRMEATVFAPVETMPELRVGASYPARLGPPLDIDVEATLRYLEPRIDPGSGTVRAIFVIDNAALGAPAGVDLFVEVASRMGAAQSE